MALQIGFVFGLLNTALALFMAARRGEGWWHSFLGWMVATLYCILAIIK
jgi:hypothetical protein